MFYYYRKTDDFAKQRYLTSIYLHETNVNAEKFEI